MVTERGLTLGGEHTIQYTDDILQNYTPETCIILLTNVTPINSIKIKKKKRSILWVAVIESSAGEGCGTAVRLS